jgi:hypothetical protein
MPMPDTPFPLVLAYIDPGTGSYVLQLAIAGALGASYAVKHYWNRLKGLFSRKTSSSPDDARG